MWTITRQCRREHCWWNLIPSDDLIALKQIQAQHDQALAQLGAAHPNLPITRISNQSDLTSQQAEVVGSEAALAAAQHDLDSSVARLKESQATNERNQADLARYQTLLDKQEVARADYDQYKATAAAQIANSGFEPVGCRIFAKDLWSSVWPSLRSNTASWSKRKTMRPLQVAIREADIKSQQANAEATQAALEQSRLNLSYTRISAPVAGVITQRSAEVGARISKGQQLFMIVQTDDLWVTANFKETQLAHMHPGQKVRIHVDALSEEFRWHSREHARSDGSRTSVLPPENATGNYVKVIQRLSVRIRFNRRSERSG